MAKIWLVGNDRLCPEIWKKLEFPEEHCLNGYVWSENTNDEGVNSND